MGDAKTPWRYGWEAFERDEPDVVSADRAFVAAYSLPGALDVVKHVEAMQAWHSGWLAARRALGQPLLPATRDNLRVVRLRMIIHHETCADCGGKICGHAAKIEQWGPNGVNVQLYHSQCGPEYTSEP